MGKRRKIAPLRNRQDAVADAVADAAAGDADDAAEIADAAAEIAVLYLRRVYCD